MVLAIFIVYFTNTLLLHVAFLDFCKQVMNASYSIFIDALQLALFCLASTFMKPITSANLKTRVTITPAIVLTFLHQNIII